MTSNCSAFVAVTEWNIEHITS